MLFFLIQFGLEEQKDAECHLSVVLNGFRFSEEKYIKKWELGQEELYTPESLSVCSVLSYYLFVSHFNIFSTMNTNQRKPALITTTEDQSQLNLTAVVVYDTIHSTSNTTVFYKGCH